MTLRRYLGIILLIITIFVSGCLKTDEKPNEQSGVDLSKSSLSGTVREAGKGTLSEATIQLKGTGYDKTITTDMDGKYSFTGLKDGDYTLSLTKEFYFPQSKQISVKGSTVLDIAMVYNDTFTAHGVVKHRIKRSQPVEGVTIRFNDGSSTVTDSDGTWTKTLAGSITVTPEKAGWSFDPVTHNIGFGDVPGEIVTFYGEEDPHTIVEDFNTSESPLKWTHDETGEKWIRVPGSYMQSPTVLQSHWGTVSTNIYVADGGTISFKYKLEGTTIGQFKFELLDGMTLFGDVNESFPTGDWVEWNSVSLPRGEYTLSLTYSRDSWEAGPEDDVVYIDDIVIRNAICPMP